MVLLCECLQDFYQPEQSSWWLTTYSRYLLLIKVAFKGIHKNGNQISRFLLFFFKCKNMKIRGIEDKALERLHSSALFLKAAYGPNKRTCHFRSSFRVHLTGVLFWEICWQMLKISFFWSGCLC